MQRTPVWLVRALLAASALLLAQQACSPPAMEALALPSGVPSPDRAWTLADYSQAVSVLVTLPNEQLPRSSSEPGARLIARLSDPSPLAFCADRSRPLAERMEACPAAGDSADALFRRYIAAAQQDRSFADDALRVSVFILRYAEVMNGLAHEFLSTLDSADPTYETRLAGLAQMRLGFAQVLLGGAIMLQDRSAFSDEVRAEYAAILSRSFQILAPDLPAGLRAQIVDRVAQIVATETNSSIRSSLAVVVQSGNEMP